MKVLVTGSGTSGSWKIRGEQLGAAIGATVIPRASAADVQQCDVVVMVKRVLGGVVEAAQRFKKPLIYDIVDWWPQPEGNQWPISTAIRHTIARLNEVKPAAVIYPNKQMLDHIGFRGHVLYHHARLGLSRKEYIPKHVATVGYEGSEAYLSGYMRMVIEDQCRERGWCLEINPSNYLDLDIVVAFRDGHFNGPVPTAWKSNVKLVNAQAAGIAFVGGLERSYQETACVHDRLIENSALALREAFDELTHQEARQLYHRESPIYSLAQAAREYKYIIERSI